VDLHKQSVSEKLQSVADRFGLTPEQCDKIKETHNSFAARRQALRDQRRDLFESDRKAINEILTPEQRKQADDLIEDRIDARKPDEGPVAWAEEALLHELFAHRLKVAAHKLGLTPEQRYHIKERLAGSAEKHRDQRRARRELVEEEYKVIAEALTPEQREKVRNYFHDHVVVVDLQLDPNDPRAVALLKETNAERLEATADKLGLTDDQRAKIKSAYSTFAANYTAQREQREALRKQELKAQSEILAPEQREKVSNYFADSMANQ
jgi:Spy/CpxP family protein refolding chaperone